MAISKRDLKKFIRYTCGNVAAECVLARYAVENIDIDAMNKVIFKIVELQTRTLERCSVAFEHVPSDFDNRKEYRKALRSYRRKACAKLLDDFNTELNDIVKQMNAILPQKQKDLNKLNA